MIWALIIVSLYALLLRWAGSNTLRELEYWKSCAEFWRKEAFKNLEMEKK